MAIELRSGLIALTLALAPVAASAQGRPLSAIDWLSDTVARPPAPAAIRPEPPVKPLGELDRITTSTLSARNLDAIGVLPVTMTELDRRLWAGSMLPRLQELLAAEGPEPPPALRDLLQRLMLAELDPPIDADGGGAFLLLRIDRLLQGGALEAAHSLVEAARPLTPDLFRRSFDIALLMATEDAACAEQRANPRIAPTVSARIFCLARGGDWKAAELTLNTSRALGRITPEEDMLLSRFLEPEADEDAEPLPVPERLTPLTLRIYEAIGEPISATSLPLAFAHGDLTPASGWKARLEAAERLARAGAIAPSQLFSIYGERRPAASGGIWDRVAAIQDLERAMARRDAEGVGRNLLKAWEEMSAAELEIPFAETHAAALAGFDLAPEPARLAARLGLLGRDFITYAESYAPDEPRDQFLRGIALGRITTPVPAEGVAYAVAPVFGEGRQPPELSRAMQMLFDADRKGEAALLAIDKVTFGLQGDLRAVTEGMTVLRRLGLETTARQTALQLLLLERRG